MTTDATAIETVGKAWGAELLEAARGGDPSAAAAPIRRDPGGWWTNCAFDALDEALGTTSTIDQRHACANVAAAIVLDEAKSAEDECAQLEADYRYNPLDEVREG